ncbi:MAG: hypothetical protein QXU54_00915 [Candidatus Micrarchaeia archaeon]
MKDIGKGHIGKARDAYWVARAIAGHTSAPQSSAPQAKNLALAIAILFIVVIALNYILPQPSPKIDFIETAATAATDKLSNLPAYQPNGTLPQIVGLGGGFLQGNQTEQGPPSYNYSCTPLGDPVRLLSLDTTYRIIYDGTPIYTQSTFQGYYGTTAVHSVSTRAIYNGEKISTNARYTYGLDGKCVQVEYSFPYGDTKRAQCNSYPIWFVCSELASESAFVRDDAVALGGKKYAVKVYRSGTMEAWVGSDIPILFRMDASGTADDGTNKSISMELVSVGNV